MYAASHHANAAIALGRAAGAADVNTSFVAPIVLAFLSLVFERLGTVEHFALYTHAATELAIHKKESGTRQDGVCMKQPNPYRCAAGGCESNTGDVLRRCKLPSN